MDWTSGYVASWRLYRMNARTWAEQGEAGRVLTMSVKRSCTEDVPLIESADITVDGDFEDGWYKVVMVAEQGGSERHDVGVYLFETTYETHGAGKVTGASGYSVLKPADDCLVVMGEYVAKGSKGGEAAAQILRECVAAPVVVEGDDFVLGRHVVFDSGMTKLAAAWSLLRAGGRAIRLTGSGEIVIEKMPEEPAIELSRVNAKLLHATVKSDFDSSAVPNRYFAMQGDRLAIATNTDPESKVSYPSRGRWVDVLDKAPIPVDGENLDLYAQRRLQELSTVTRKVSYSREYDPRIVPFSVVRGSLADVGIEGDMRVMTQTLVCGAGIYVQETCGQEVAV